jgi:hypothetical protein
MAVLLLLALAYWWLENLPHEIFGTVLFALLGWHFAVNRTWFRILLRGVIIRAGRSRSCSICC